MTPAERAFAFDDYGPMSKTDLDILRNAIGDTTTRQESAVARTMVGAWKAGRRFAEMRERLILDAIRAGGQS